MTPKCRRLGIAHQLVGKTAASSESVTTGNCRDDRRVAAAANASPIGIIVFQANPFLKTGIRPEMRTRSQAMPDRINVNVIEVMSEIDFIRDCMLPISPMPDIALAM